METKEQIKRNIAEAFSRATYENTRAKYIENFKARWNIDEDEGNISALYCIIKDWANEAGIKSFKETIAFHLCGKDLYIITKSCGFFIGYHGQLYNKFKEILSANGYNVEIKFIDLFCGGVKEF